MSGTAPVTDIDALVTDVHTEIARAGVATAAAGLRHVITERVRATAPLLAPATVARVADRVLAAVVGLGPLDPLLRDPSVSEVMVNGPDQVWVERRGRLERTSLDLDASTIRHLIERIVGPLGLRADRASPLVDARLPDGSRVNVVLPPLAIDGPCITVRRFGARAVTLSDMAPPPIPDLLRWAVQARGNVLVSGGTGAGKTTLLNALGAELDAGERVITVEDAAELRLPGEHVIRLEARPANADGMGAITIRDLVRNALRMRPDRLVVGEVRGGEALDMVQAMNTGHDGSLSTCHANGPTDALARIETMVLLAGVGLPLAAVREQIAAAIDLVIHVVRRSDGSRHISEVAEVCGAEGGNRLTTRLLAGADGPVQEPHRPPRRSGVAPFQEAPR